jgi:hypothetical protein
VKKLTDLTMGLFALFIAACGAVIAITAALIIAVIGILLEALPFVAAVLILYGIYKYFL